MTGLCIGSIKYPPESWSQSRELFKQLLELWVSNQISHYGRFRFLHTRVEDHMGRLLSSVYCSCIEELALRLVNFETW